jgi:hypothetical protein
MPQNGYPFNQIVQSLLENKLHTLNLNSDKFNESKHKIDELNKRFKEIELIQNDPEFYIDEYFRELIREIDLRREFLIESIQKESNKLIESVNQWKSELVKMENKKMTGSIEKDRLRLAELNSMFDSLEIDKKKMEEIISQKSSKELAESLNSIYKDCQNSLLGSKTYKLQIDCEDCDSWIHDLFGRIEVRLLEKQIENIVWY